LCPFIERDRITQRTDDVKHHIHMAKSTLLATRSSAGLFGEDIKIKTESVPGQDRETFVGHLAQVLEQSRGIIPSHLRGGCSVVFLAVPQENVARTTRKCGRARDTERPVGTPVEVFTGNILGGFNVKR
jgi:hypothetical protein